MSPVDDTQWPSPPWRVRVLGPARVPSPLQLSLLPGDEVPDYVGDDERVLFDVEFREGDTPRPDRAFERAGPREHIYFEPGRTTLAVVTAGGLCPGINNVIRSLVLTAHHRYGVKRLLGIRYGFAGLDPAAGLEPLELTPDAVQHVHNRGGSMLGTSRGPRDIDTMLDRLGELGVDALLVVGGDGTMRGAHALAERAQARGQGIGIIGVPKTIDNDIDFVDKTFGFETAVSMARIAIDAAHTEATSAQRGIGLVRLMGRDAGFIAAHATLASRDVNVCLVPEVHFKLDGENGLLAHLQRRLDARGHAVIVVAEGCGKVLADTSETRDASGNLRFADASLDIGRYLERRLVEHFRDLGAPVSLKYIDPSYMIRGVPANAMDAVFCDQLARSAVHAAMAGKTDLMVGRWHGSFTHVPLPLVLASRRRIDPDRALWLAVTETTGQPRFH
ncbi:MAG: ATP-dependent 6-phosphofructokinase [Deltaproteobacteria bacterium]|nr:ATP-dependent 6-phosphofructokinase [Deltaproteobacteria bacterium]MBK8240204.1 ATP-dependent 6-phosphofructokinase [Deltaproteobacteria bacterium]MBK8715805.1 ATP-dependent 6-phosphofructokinase [Deltaproteobacteria bacterium]MBP7292298.1 ATP-dependent 6-phosphofructokinase [Nannocystaceae bacterium]